VPDQTIRCQDCGQDFDFTIRDQDFYADKGFMPPKRCRACREKRKQNPPPDHGGRGDRGNRGGRR